MKKKIVTLILTVLLAFIFAGCDSNGNRALEDIDNYKPDKQEETKEVLSLTSAIIENDNLILVMSDGTRINAGKVQGEQGKQGVQGIKGDKGDKGDEGEKGDKGDKGDKGETGSGGSDPVNLTIDNFQSGVISNSVSSSSTDSQLPTAKSVFNGLNNKQDKLTAGSNISIVNNVISATGQTEYSWDAVTNKPFSTIGSGLKVEDNVLKTDITSDIVDNLTTDDNTKALSAKQGKVLNEAIESIPESYSKDEIDDLFEAFFNILYPVGSQYTSYNKEFDPNNAESWNGKWEKIEEGYFVGSNC